jgi:phosphate starvation-inducible PhoH-like protein
VTYKSPKRPTTSRVTAKTPRQQEYLDAMGGSALTFAIGCAGTGKTYLALCKAVEMLLSKEIRHIIVTRPNVSSGEKSLGFFKGSKEEKIAEWMRPALKIMKKLLGPERLKAMLESGVIQMEPLETMRGETFDDSFVLLDEAQNVTIEDLEMFLTRIGENTKVVIDGDVEQTDLKARSGLASVIKMVRQDSGTKYPVIEFDLEDVVRSGICKEFIRMFREYRKNVTPHIKAA